MFVNPIYAPFEPVVVDILFILNLKIPQPVPELKK